MIWRLVCAIMLVLAGPVLAKDQVSPKKGAIPNGLFASQDKDQLDFAIVGCRQSYDVLKCVIQFVEATPDEAGQCTISVHHMRENLPWQTTPLDGGADGHWLALREQKSSRCKVSRSLTFSRSKDGGRMDILRQTRLVRGSADDSFCKKIPELQETWIQDPSIVKVPGCQRFSLEKQ